MAATNRPLPKSQGQIVPCYYNPGTDSFEPLEGQSGSPFYLQRGTIAMESWQGSTNETKTFTDKRYAFAAVNDGESDLTFMINGQSRVIKPGEAYQSLFEEFTQVQIQASSSYRGEVLK